MASLEELRLTFRICVNGNHAQIDFHLLIKFGFNSYSETNFFGVQLGIIILNRHWEVI